MVFLFLVTFHSCFHDKDTYMHTCTCTLFVCVCRSNWFIQVDLCLSFPKPTMSCNLLLYNKSWSWAVFFLLTSLFFQFLSYYLFIFLCEPRSTFSHTNPAIIFIRIILNLYINFGRINVFTVSSFPINKYCMIYDLCLLFIEIFMLSLYFYSGRSRDIVFLFTFFYIPLRINI